MPPVAQHPQAKFDPIPPDLDLHALVERTPNFHWVLRISAAQIRNIGPQEFEKLVFLHVVHGGKPLVIEKWNDRLPKSLFGVEWLEATYNKKPENVRDLGGQTDMPMTIGHYLRSMKTLTNQWTPTNFRDERRQRLYLKDMDCPPEWHDYLRKVIPPNLFYLNENVDERSRKGRSDDVDIFQEGRSVAPAGDLMSSLPEEMRAQNLMCYIGHEGTYTPAHREMCASLGQNIMVDASGDENGEKPGSSIWFMTETKDRHLVREYFLSMLGHDIEIEKHFAQINAWKKATFPVYIVEQKVGDFILVPPLAPHQVWNRGTRTVKVAWNRTTVETLQLALHEALPKARLVCRDEQYKNKAIIFYTLEKYYKEMLDMERTADIGLLGFGQDLIKSSTRMKQMAADFKALFRLYTEVLVDEMFATKEKDVEYIEFDSNITCSYCRANIFNRFLTCKHCIRQLVNGDEDTYDICMECYAMGRSCFCVSNLSWCEQWRWSYLVDRYEAWRALIIKNDGYISFESSPLPLELARRMSGKKSIAQVCQEQLRKRPWKDLNQIKEPSEPEESEIEVDDNGRPVKKKKKRRVKKGDVYRCHVCQHKEYVYKLAFCSSCPDAYCYGVLYRAFDLMPQTVMQNENWQCPKCLKICNCAACRRAGNGDPYIPKTTTLGHDTRRIADDRSVESLVDFRVHNLSWLRSVGDASRSLSSKRMQRLQQAAEAEKAKQAELANQVPALPDSALAESMDAAMQQAAHVEDGVPGTAPMAEGAPPTGVPDGQQPNGEHADVAEVADMSVTMGQDQSPYPDPSILGREGMLGMGYYEQDDSDDRILFDPYQMPSADTMAAAVDDEPEMSEYLKKQLRIAKRRARQEEDNDPDFRISRSHHRKKPKLDHEPPQHDPQEVALSNMDPALFGGDVTMVDAPAVDAAAVDAGQATSPAEAIQQPAPESEEPDGAASEPRAYSPNRPALRHARPKASYLEEENGEEEFNDIVIPRSLRPPEGITQYNPGDANKDPLDLASAAIMAITGRSTPAQGPSAQATPAASGKKRGRPRKSDVLAAQSAAPNPAPAEKPEKTEKRRGRPARARASLSTGPENEDDASAAELDAQLAQQLEGFDDEGELISSEPTVPASPRRRSRPPKSAPLGTQPQRKRVEVAVELPSRSLLSMADRMKLEGKKFKIGQRKSAGPAKPATPVRDSARESEAGPGPSEEASQPPREPAVADKGTAGGGSSRGRGGARGRGGRRSAPRDAPDSADKDFDPTAEEEAVSDEASSPSPSPSRRPSPAPAPVAAEAPPASPSPPAASPPPPEPSSPAQPEPEPEPEPEPPRVPSGPTIVRLLDADEEEEEYGGYGSEDDGADETGESETGQPGNDEYAGQASGSGSDDDDDDDDEDIPARIGRIDEF
ncbi:f10f1bf6-704a-42f0-a39a-08db30bad628 [Thermothielavioides terrestris]|uniref:F10f1bf6-704a-42f0-a39a-08db30bad628 n=1 Tax=Thermothielavioides terrestris TaxID=2587410 RepID=A0A3S4BHJ4_9PEZI|nr:f10f1bf6-704a-42f0-a39a-08db30bad628 [Thermothielavioides terrestris]